MNGDFDESDDLDLSDTDISDSSTEQRKTVTLGQYDDRTVLVAIRQRPPEARAPDEFAANVYVPCDEDAHIFRVDTAHSGCHADRLYLPKNVPNRLEDYSVEFYSPEGVLSWLLEDDRWRTFVSKYDKNHGLPPRR